MTEHVTWRTLRSGDDRLSLRWSPRSIVVASVLSAVALALCALALTTGDFPVPLAQVIDVLTGHGQRIDRFIVLNLRMPRLVAAVLIGAALGMSGAVFQGLSRNPLGSPDILGFTSGAATGAVLELLVFHAGQGATALGAVLGGLMTAAVVQLLSYTKGAESGYRLVLVGIGVGAVLQAVTGYLLTNAHLYQAANAQIWLIGSLNGINWSVVVPLAITLCVLVPLTAMAGRALSWLDLGDDMARGLGIKVERQRLLLIITGTMLAAAGTAAAGPISFVALAAPQICRRLTGVPGVQPFVSAVTGAVILLASDLIAQRVSRSGEMPVGAVTGVVGGAYLCWLLAREWKAGRG